MKKSDLVFHFGFWIYYSEQFSVDEADDVWTQYAALVKQVNPQGRMARK